MCDIFLLCKADMIYEDVQRDSGPVAADNGWSSSEFESYDEHSDNETKVPTRSKVLLVRVCVCVFVCVRACLMCVFISHRPSPPFILNSVRARLFWLLSNT